MHQRFSPIGAEENAAWRKYTAQLVYIAMARSTVAVFLPDFVELLYCFPSRRSLPPHSISARFNVTLQRDHVASHQTVASTVEIAHQSQVPQKELTQSLWSSRLSFHQGSIVLSGETG